MKPLIIAFVIILTIIFCLLISMYILIKRYQKTADEMKEQYTDEAQQLDTMAGLLTCLFDINNPNERKLCVHCQNLKACVKADIVPADETFCIYFEEKQNENRINRCRRS